MPAKAVLLPFYVVVDTSLSMDGEPITAVNDIIPTLCDLLRENPTLRDKIRFSLVEFSSRAELRVPLSDLRNVQQPPDLTADGATSYAAAFRLVRELIEMDTQQLRVDDYAFHRPAVFFLTDGEPTDADDVWHREFEALVTGANWPNVVPFGVGETNPATLSELVHPKDRFQAYTVADGHTASDAVRDTTQVLIQSVLASAKGTEDGEDGFVLDPGFQTEAVVPVPMDEDIPWKD
ncbi:vWA domain-containing protein [Streptomyces sp. YIM S03343]